LQQVLCHYPYADIYATNIRALRGISTKVLLVFRMSSCHLLDCAELGELAAIVAVHFFRFRQGVPELLPSAGAGGNNTED